MQSFISELRRRNVLRVAAFYIAAAWVLVQAATQIFPFFDIPNWVVRWVVIAAVIGLPFVMLFSWYYELTPDGLKLESQLTAQESQDRTSARKLDRWIIAVLALAVVLLLSDRLALPKTAAPSPPAAPGAPASADNTAATAVSEKSIAVLPFENLSDDKANAYFAVGIQDEILTRLAKIGALSVVSRTSTAHYASSPENLPEIAKQLGVANILEGSVQKAGDAVHINVQLIHATTDKHLWAETYDRKLNDTFGVEGEVAQAIADALNARLSGAERVAVDQKPTQNAAAYDAYLRGLAFELSLSELNGHQLATAQYTEAVTLDPAFALAWAHLSMVQSLVYFNEDHSPDRLAKVGQAADTAMKLQPELGEAWLAKGYFLYRCKSDYDGALAAFEQARTHMPGSAEVLAATAFVERRQGKWEDSLNHLQAATQQDPGNLSYLDELASTYLFLNRFGEARVAIDRALAIAPGNTGFIGKKVVSYLDEGDFQSADSLLNAQTAPPEDIGLLNARLNSLLLHRQFDGEYRLLKPFALERGDELGEQTVNLFSAMGWAQRYAGDSAGAVATFKQGRERGEQLRKQSQSASMLMGLAMIEAGLNDRESALRDAHQAVEMAANDAFLKVPLESNLAEIEANVGDTDSAIKRLASLLGVPGCETAASLRLDPYLDPLRSDPRFQKLIAGH